MKPIKIAEALCNEYQDINERVRHLNKGGCGHFAEHLYHTLIKLGVIPKLGVVTDTKKGMDRKLAGKSEFNKKGNYIGGKFANVAHVVVIIDDMLIDSRGIHKTVTDCWQTIYKTDYELSDLLTIEQLKKWNRDLDMWNSRFKRYNINTIRKRLKECYNKVNKGM